MSACSGRSSETGCALRAPAHSWAPASTLSWTCFSLFHTPAQQHKHDPERDHLPKPKESVLFSELQPRRWLKTKLLTKNKQTNLKLPCGAFKVTTDVCWLRLNLPWGQNACAHAEGFGVSHPTLAQFARQRLHCSCTTPLCALASLSPA